MNQLSPSCNNTYWRTLSTLYLLFINNRNPINKQDIFNFSWHDIKLLIIYKKKYIIFIWHTNWFGAGLKEREKERLHFLHSQWLALHEKEKESARQTFINRLCSTQHEPPTNKISYTVTVALTVRSQNNSRACFIDISHSCYHNPRMWYSFILFFWSHFVLLNILNISSTQSRNYYLIWFESQFIIWKYLITVKKNSLSYSY